MVWRLPGEAATHLPVSQSFMMTRPPPQGSGDLREKTPRLRERCRRSCFPHSVCDLLLAASVERLCLSRVFENGHAHQRAAPLKVGLGSAWASAYLAFLVGLNLVLCPLPAPNISMLLIQFRPPWALALRFICPGHNACFVFWWYTQWCNRLSD